MNLGLFKKNDYLWIIAYITFISKLKAPSHFFFEIEFLFLEFISVTVINSNSSASPSV